MIHPTAIIHPKARLGANCGIGPYCLIGEHVELGDGCKLYSHVVIDGHTTLGKANEIFPFACLGLKTQDLKWKGGITRTVIGDQNTFRESVTVHSATNDGDATIIGSNNLFLTYVHIAHDCVLGNHIIMSGFSGLAGHVLVEDRVVFGGYAAVHQFCRIGERVMVAGHASITRDVPHFTMVAERDDVIGLNVVGLKRSGLARASIAELKAAFHDVYFTPGNIREVAALRIATNAFESAEAKRFLEFFSQGKRSFARARRAAIEDENAG